MECILEKLHVVLSIDSNKLIAQSYDSAAVICGEKGSVQATIKQPYHMHILCTPVHIN